MARTNYPIRLSYALTIHKSQGQTLKKIIVELGKKESTLGISFVALSRVKNYKDFLIQPFPLDRLTKIKNSKLLNERVNEEIRIKEIVDITLNQYQFLFN
jgi:ATP-dependent DNA helicase PIF1